MHITQARGKRGLSTVSTFVDRAEVESAVSDALGAHEQTISQWLTTNPVGRAQRLTIENPFSGGLVLHAGAASAVPGQT